MLIIVKETIDPSVKTNNAATTDAAAKPTVTTTPTPTEEDEPLTTKDVLLADAWCAMNDAEEEARANSLDYVAEALREAARMLAHNRLEAAVKAVNALSQYALENAPLQDDPRSRAAMRVAQCRTEVIATYLHYAGQEA